MEKMNEKVNEFGFDYSLCRQIREMSIGDFIRWMYDRTDRKHLLIVPAFNEAISSMPRSFHRNTVCWSESDRDHVIAETERLYDALAGIAKHYGELSDAEEENAKLLTPEELVVWRTYIRAFDTSAFDSERLVDLNERRGASRECKDILMKRDVFHETLTEEEQENLTIFQDAMLSEEEEAYDEAYQDEMQRQAEQRVGNQPTALALVMHARRLCRLMSLRAPDFIVRSEATYLAQTMVFHRFGRTFRVYTVLGDYGVEKWIC